MELFFGIGEFDLTDVEAGQRLADIIDENGMFTTFEQFDDPTALLGIRIFDIVSFAYGNRLYHMVRRHNGLNTGSPNLVDYVEKCFIFDYLDEAEYKHRQLIGEFLEDCVED